MHYQTTSITPKSLTAIHFHYIIRSGHLEKFRLFTLKIKYMRADHKV